MFSRIWLFLITLFIGASASFGIIPTHAQTGGCSTTHIIQRGETLYRIATRYNTTVAELQARNSISNPNKIYAGQQLCINGGFVPPTTPVPPANPQVGTGTVTAWFLNVRYGAGTQHSIIRVVQRGDTFPVIGRSADSKWYQITVDAIAGTKGWVYASYFNVASPQNLPIVNGDVAPYSANITLVRNAFLHISPDGNQGIVPQEVRAGTTVRVVGRNANSIWFEITTENGNRWISLDAFPSNFQRDLFPVTG